MKSVVHSALWQFKQLKEKSFIAQFKGNSFIAQFKVNTCVVQFKVNICMAQFKENSCIGQFKVHNRWTAPLKVIHRCNETFKMDTCLSFF